MQYIILLLSLATYTYTSVEGFGLSDLIAENIDIAHENDQASVPWRPQMCKFHRNADLFKNSEGKNLCTTYGKASFTNGPLARMMDIVLPYYDVLDDACSDNNQARCLYSVTNEGKKGNSMDYLRNIQVYFFQEKRNKNDKHRSIGGVGPFWIRRSGDNIKELSIEHLPGYYEKDFIIGNKTTPRTDLVRFRFFAPDKVGESKAAQIEMSASTATFCWDNINSEQGDKRCWGISQSEGKKTFRNQHRNVGKLSHGHLQVNATLKRIGEKGSDENAVYIQFAWREDFCTTVLHEKKWIHLIIYEASSRPADTLDLNASFKPVLFYKTQYACGADGHWDKLVKNYIFREGIAGILTQVKSLENEYLYSGGETDYRKFTSFYPQWKEPINRRIRLAITFCDNAGYTCTEYDIHDVTV